nr:putative membrane protein [Rhodococcus sp. JVH1]
MDQGGRSSSVKPDCLYLRSFLYLYLHSAGAVVAAVVIAGAAFGR